MVMPPRWSRLGYETLQWRAGGYPATHHKGRKGYVNGERPERTPEASGTPSGNEIIFIDR